MSRRDDPALPGLLQIEVLQFRQGRHQLGPLSLQLQAGERVAVLGPSGAGKSTLLRLLARELQAEAGEIRLDGRDLSAWSARELARRRAVLPQQHAVAFGLTAAMVVGLGRICREEPAAQRELMAHAALAQAQAEHLAQRRFDTLSGGEQARVQLARVFAQAWDSRDGLLLMDEPLAALDPGLTLGLLRAVDDFAASRGHAVVAVLHDLNVALNRFDRLWLLKNGQLLATPPAQPAPLALLEQLYDTPLRLLQDDQGVAVLPRHLGGLAA